MTSRSRSIDTFGIRNVTSQDIRNAASLGRTLKLAGFSGKAEDGIFAYVEPVLLPSEDVMAYIPSNYNLIRYRGAYAGIQSYVGEGAGRYPTAYNVVEDLFDILAGEKHFYTVTAVPAVPDNTAPVHRYSVRTSVITPGLREMAEDRQDGYVITKPVSVRAMHSFIREQLIRDPAAFIAGIPD